MNIRASFVRLVFIELHFACVTFVFMFASVFCQSGNSSLPNTCNIF